MVKRLTLLIIAIAICRLSYIRLSVHLRRVFLGKSLFCLATDSAIKPRTLARTGLFHVRSLLSGGVV